MEEQATILAVDDTEDNLDLLEFVLKRKSIRFLRASNGKECLAMAERERPDVILLDIQMPGMDGFETIRQLRARSITSSIPVIVLTAQKKDPGSIERGLMLGADEYLTKPIDIDELLVRCRTMIRLRRSELELERMKSDMMAMLIHDLRAPMTGVKGVVDFLFDELSGKRPITDDHVALVGSTQISIHKTIELINELLDLSRYEAGKVHLERLFLTVSQIVESVRSQMDLQFRNKDITITTLFDPDLPKVLVDPTKIMQVVMNLFSNAYKFTDPGGSVDVRAAICQGEFGRMVEVTITNTGTGIQPEDLTKIFVMWQQARSARTATEEGTGLGLAICKLIIEAHGGTIHASSVPGKTTTFYFTLPIAERTDGPA